MSLMHTFVGHKAQINTLDLAPNTNIIASGSRDGHVNIWNLLELMNIAPFFFAWTVRALAWPEGLCVSVAEGCE